jgi:hypothetical protein
MANTIKIDGLDQFVRNLKKLDSDLPKALRVGFNGAAQIIVDYAKPKVPHRTGKAAGSIRAQSTRSTVRVSEGGARAPWMPWLDFGGRVGRKKSVSRPFLREGRFLYAGLHAERDRINDAVVNALLDTARAAGVEVDS